MRLCLRNVFVRTTIRFICVFLLAGATARHAQAQTPVGIANVSGNVEPAAAAVAVNNPWFGAQVVHRFAGGDGGDFASNLLAAGQFVFDVPLGAAQFHLPVVSNFGGKVGADPTFDTTKKAIDSQMKELLQSTSGITAGLFPYYPFLEHSNVMLTVHGIGAWRYNGLRPYGEPAGTQPADDGSDIVQLHQWKSGIGFEAVIGTRGSGTAAVTLSVTPVMTWFVDKNAYKRAFGEERSHLGAVEFVAILPVRANGFGLVFEAVAGPEGRNAFRAGLMLAGQP